MQFQHDRNEIKKIMQQLQAYLIKDQLKEKQIKHAQKQKQRLNERTNSILDKSN
jgi:hypothetical protein